MSHVGAKPIRAKRAYMLALLTGLLYFLAFPGLEIWPLSFVALVPLIWALRGQTTKRCTGLGWVAGMGMTVCGFYWLRDMLATFSQMPEPVPILLMLLLCGYQSGRIALCGFLYGRAANRGWNPQFVFAGAFATSELLYPLLFPWYYGATVHDVLPLIQVGEIGGPIFTGLVLVAANLAVAHFLEHYDGRVALDKRILAIGVVVPVLATAYGYIRISQVRALQAQGEAIRVALVQGNQPLLDKPKSKKVHIALTKKARREGVDLVVWSEAAVQANLLEKNYRWKTRKRLTWSLGVPTIVGTLISEKNPAGHPLEWTDYNTALITNANGVVQSRYDKQYLLMFGEYLPLGEQIPALYSLSPNSSAFSSGTSLEPLLLGDKRLTTTICYEDILPSFVNDLVRHADPHVLINLTNDAWFGDSTEPWIHLALAKLRTVEHRRYLVRSTNSGVSAIVDATGAVVARGGTFKREVVIGEVRYLTGSTIYRTLGDKLWWLLAVVMVGMSTRRKSA